jgi:hypothetical protein
MISWTDPKPVLANGFVALYQICIKSHYSKI